MCVITDENGVVLSVSLIPGSIPIKAGLKWYFPVVGDYPKEGDVGHAEKQLNGGWTWVAA